jgi:hypothetical protein
MPRRYDKLVELAGEFSNYTAKYLQQIGVSFNELNTRLEQAGLRDEVHLWQPAWNLEREMDIVSHVAPEGAERIRFLGCYYGLQYLRMNIQAIEALRAGVVPGASREEVYREFLTSLGSSYTQLVVTFMRKVLDILLAGTELPPFVICGVGTMTDQDDVDIAVVVEEERGREALNSVLSKLSSIMLRYATRFHFYLSERVSPESFATSLDEYRTHAETYPGDYIIISELLNAEPLFGDRALFERLQREISDRYYADSDADPVYHEGFVRGALGDVVALANRDFDADRIVPKEEALRVIKTLVQIKRSLHGLREPNIWPNLQRLADIEPWNAEKNDLLERGLIFFEVLRYLYQLLVVQDEVIILDTPVMTENLSRVAAAMGYRRRGTVGSEDSLLVHYYDSVDQVRAVARDLAREVEEHLRTGSVFLNLVSAAPRPPGELLKQTLRLIRFLARVAFWDDVFELLLASDKKLLRALVADFNSLPPAKRERRVNELVGLVKRNAQLFIKLLVLLGENRDDVDAHELFEALARAFLREFGTFYNPAREGAHLFAVQPTLVHRYLAEIDYDAAKEFMDLTSREVTIPSLQPAAASLRELCRLRYYGSAYLRRYLGTTLKKYPDCLNLLDDVEALAEKAQGILAEAALVPSPAAKKALLGDYYDLELLRIGLMTLRGATIEETNAAYTEFSDDYLNYLFDACREELAEEYGRWVTSFDVMALYAAGGHAREWAFNDDYDLLVLIDSDDEKLQELGGAVISAMSSEITKRGMMPHFRLVEHFGSYVIPVRQLEEFFRRGEATDFIEKSQLLESRLVIGTSTFEEEAYERIIKPFVFDRAEDYIADMKAEMASRQRAVGEVFRPNNVKECVGGLRDIVMTMLICKARFGIRDPVTSHILEGIGRVYPQAGLELRSLYNSMCFLKNLRDVYRLAVCLDDNLDFEHADVVGEILGFDGAAAGEQGHQVQEAFERTTAKVAAEIESILAKVT